VRLLFAGTRGEIEARTPRHAMHSALVVFCGGGRVMVDCGADWLGRFGGLDPAAVVVTHAHPDHAWGLREGAPCPVYATRESWALMERYPVRERRVVEPRRPFRAEGLVFEAFPVEHSTRAPAVGYRISAGRTAVFYAPDVVYIHGRGEALRGVELYAGDGASVARPLVRRRGEALIGHAPIRTQLTWCAKEGVRRAVFTHCGTEIVAGDEERLEREVRRLGAERGVEAALAYDGMEVGVP